MNEEGAKLCVKAALDATMTATDRIERARQAKLPLAPVGEVDAPELAEEEPGPRRPGRPPGALNRRTADLARFILSQYTHPVQVLAEMYSRPVEDLARVLDCDKLEAARLQIGAAKEVAEYVAQKMPRSVEVDTNAGTVAFVMASEDQIAAMAEATAEDSAPWLDATDVTPPPPEDADNSRG